MADKLQYTLTLDTSDFTANIKKAEDGLGNFSKSAESGVIGRALAGFTAGLLSIGAAFGFVTKSISEFIEKSKRIAVVDNALKAIGSSYKEMSNQIDELSQKNAITDEEISRIISYGSSVGVTKDKIIQFTQTVIDYSARTGRGVQRAMLTVAETVKKGGDAFDNLSRNVSGAGEAAANADYGWTRLSIAIGDVQAEIGKLISSELAGWIKDLTKLLNQLLDALRAYNNLTPESKLAQKITEEAKFAAPGQTKMAVSQFGYSKEEFEIFKQSGALNSSQTLGFTTYWIDIAKLKAYADTTQKVKDNTSGIKENQLETNELTKADIQYKKEVEGIISRQLANDKKIAEQSGQALKEIANQMISLIPVTGAEAQQFQKIGDAVADVAGQIAKIDFSKIALQTSDWVTLLIKGVVAAFAAIVDWVSKADSGMADGAAELDKWKEKLDYLNSALEYYNALLGKEKAIRNKTAEDIDREIESTQNLIDADQRDIDARKARNNVINTSLAQYNAAIAAFSTLKPGFARDFAISEIQKKINDLNKEYQDNLIEITRLETDQIINGNAIEDLEVEKTNLLNKQVDLEKQRNALIDSRLNKLKQEIALGLVDVGSYAGVGYIRQQLNAVGLSGLEMGNAALGLGVNSADLGRGYGTSIGAINVNNFEANLNTLTGSIAQAISMRLG